MPARVAQVVLLLLLALPAGASAKEKPYYVNVGDSYAVGYQPGRATGGKGGATTDGYAERFTALAAEDGHPVRLRNFGCVGASTGTILLRHGCPSGVRGARHAVEYKGTQADAAVRFLEAHREHTKMITVSLGRNDIRRCLSAGSLDCVRAAQPVLAGNLKLLLERLRAAAGPDVRIIGLTYPNVDLATWSHGPRGRRHARRAQAAFREVLNPTLKRRYQAVGGTFLDVTEETGGYAPLPAPVKYVCEYTWYCKYQDVHASPEGYALIAELIAGELARR
jgi:lysophospholipase L1-like esterase